MLSESGHDATNRMHTETVKGIKEHRRSFVDAKKKEKQNTVGIHAFTMKRAQSGEMRCGAAAAARTTH